MEQQPTEHTGPVTSPASVYILINNDNKDKTSAKNRYEKSFPYKPLKALSIVQMILGFISVASQVVVFFVNGSHGHEGIGEGIFCGLWFVLAGIIGFVAIHRTTTCKITAFMVLNIVACLAASVLFITSLIMTIMTSHYHGMAGVVAFHSVMLISAITEGVVSILCSALCCRACCCIDGGGASSVVYLPQGSDIDPTKIQVIDLARSGMELKDGLLRINKEEVGGGNVAAAVAGDEGYTGYRRL